MCVFHVSFVSKCSPRYLTDVSFVVHVIGVPSSLMSCIWSGILRSENILISVFVLFSVGSHLRNQASSLSMLWCSVVMAWSMSACWVAISISSAYEAKVASVVGVVIIYYNKLHIHVCNISSYVKKECPIKFYQNCKIFRTIAL